eukprot:m.6898 g.6898  ORF g.6898 m.6898 type:complete len:327 (+) comp2146_c0_seq1:110-1090(+)
MAEAHVQDSLSVITKAIRLFGVESVCLSYNGGKDSTVILHLLREAVPDMFHKIPIIFFKQPNEFPEINAFIDLLVERYKLNIMYITEDFKAGVARILKETSIKAIFLGTRAGDPYTHQLETFSPSDDDWPAFMRVHPIIKWTYPQVWAYLRDRPYCSLYDQGYTSLGSTLNTVPNPLLKDGNGGYRPARELADGRYERCGRRGCEVVPPNTAAIVCLMGTPSRALDECKVSFAARDIKVKEILYVEEDEPLLPALKALAFRHPVVVLIDEAKPATANTMLAAAQRDLDYGVLLQKTAIYSVPGEHEGIPAAIAAHLGRASCTVPAV